jgi:radical SAM superfamily enzyme YgiQ (UPF0313 family)
MQILLVQPDLNRMLGLQHFIRIEPLGLEMLSGALGKQHQVTLLDLRLEPNALPAALAELRPDMVGISSTFTVNTRQTLAIAQVVKEADPRTFVVVGGHHPSLNPSDLNHPAVDCIVVGEGESTWHELVECLAANGDPSKVLGLVLNRHGRQISNASRPLLKNLDLLPLPDRRITAAHRDQYYMLMANPVAAVETARGCPYRCNFCSVWRFYQGGIRFKSPARVVAEVEAVDEPNVFFTDDNFLASPRRAVEIARLIRERGIRKQYLLQARSDTIANHPEMIAQWREVGLSSVFMGFEKPDQRELTAVNKHNSVENNEQALAVLRGQGIEPTTSFIVDPDYTRDDFAKLRAYVHRLQLQMPVFTILTPLPGTDLFHEVRDRLTTLNYQLFDVGHAVLPTRLPVADFYEEMARLWQAAYPRWKMELLRISMLLRDLWSRGEGQRYWKTAFAEARRFTDARSYLQDMARACEPDGPLFANMDGD